MFPESILYTNESCRKAIEAINTFSADMLLAPLTHIFAQKVDPEYPRHIFLITDGCVGNTDEVVNLVRENNGSSITHAVGIGRGADEDLVFGCAYAGNGLMISI
jgi:hypothetical protein